jgi:DnaJ-class molecular chaperone
VTDYYALLGVSREASGQEIVDAYRKMVLKCHPDRTGSPDSELFRKVQEAYKVLSDPDRRQAYDRRRGAEVPVLIVTCREPSSSARNPIREVNRMSTPHVSRSSTRDPFEEFFNLMRSVLQIRASKREESKERQISIRVE